MEWALFIAICALLLSYSSPPLTDEIQRLRAYTRPIEFDYFSWTLEASLIKLQQGAAGIPHNFDRITRKQIVAEYFALTRSLLQGESALEQLYANPNIKDKQQASQYLRQSLNKTQARLDELSALAEAVLQEQITQTLAEQNLTTGGQPIPSVLYHSSPLPNALIVSPRDHIEQTANISISPGLTADEQNDLEQRVDKSLNVSSLVVPIGGIGVYPTMVMRSANISDILNIIAHEWTHNFLTLRPLGALYEESPELRTMNETAASIAGNEIGRLALEKFYPELTTASSADLSLLALYQPPLRPNRLPNADFDFRAEMHATRVRTDELLAQGKIKEAEAYMEARRRFFWDNGYLIRKLNQAYFAFYGAYADVPGGAAGEDPVGPAVRTLRARSATLADFLNKISWMTSFEDLKKAIQ
jgi:hypothetical protein